MIGIMMFATRLASLVLLRRLSLSFWNCSIASSSWQNVFTTFCPVSISSMNPFICPRLCCCATKWLAERALSDFVVYTIVSVSTSTSNASGQLSISMLPKVMVMVINDEKTFGRLWLIICLRVSTSLVYIDMMSPWALLSKYFIGSFSMCEKRSLRSRFIVPWLTLIISLLCR